MRKRIELTIEGQVEQVSLGAWPDGWTVHVLDVVEGGFSWDAFEASEAWLRDASREPIDFRSFRDETHSEEPEGNAIVLGILGPARYLGFSGNDGAYFGGTITLNDLDRFFDSLRGMRMRPVPDDPDWNPERLKDRLREVAAAFADPDVSDETIRGWLAHPWEDVREAALLALGHLPPRPAIFDTLVAMVDVPAAPDVKAALAWALKGYGTPAEGALLRLLGENGLDLRLQTLVGLRDFGTAASLPELERVATDAPERGVRRLAEEAIKAIRARTIDR